MNMLNMVLNTGEMRVEHLIKATATLSGIIHVLELMILFLIGAAMFGGGNVVFMCLFIGVFFTGFRYFLANIRNSLIPDLVKAQKDYLKAALVDYAPERVKIIPESLLDKLDGQFKHLLNVTPESLYERLSGPNVKGKVLRQYYRIVRDNRSELYN